MSDQYDGPELARQVRMLREENERLRAERSAMIENVRFARERAERAEAERDTLRADAERYRWLRQWAGRSEEFPSDLSDPTNPEEMDAAIDAAMRKAEEKAAEAAAKAKRSAKKGG